MDKRDALRYRIAPLEMTPSEFRKVGRQLVERIAEFLCTLPDRPVTVNEPPSVIREALGTDLLPEEGRDAKDLLEEATDLLFEHSTFNGHPRFWGVITSSAAPIGALGDLLAASGCALFARLLRRQRQSKHQHCQQQLNIRRGITIVV